MNNFGNNREIRIILEYLLKSSLDLAVVKYSHLWSIHKSIREHRQHKVFTNIHNAICRELNPCTKFGITTTYVVYYNLLCIFYK